jgi:hypothetical protein
MHLSDKIDELNAGLTMILRLPPLGLTVSINLII